MTPAVPDTVIRAARAIGIQPGTLAVMHPQQARKLAREAARLHEGRRENAARAMNALAAFDDVLAEANIVDDSVARVFGRRAARGVLA